MKFLLKTLAFLVLTPLALGLALILAVVAMVGVPLLWESAIARFTGPRNPQPERPSGA